MQVRLHPAVWLPLGGALLMVSCPRPAALVRPTPAPLDVPLTPPPPLLPPGCEKPLAGLYRHVDDDTFRYALTDDGQTVTLQAFRQFGATRLDLGPAGLAVLHRTATGFHGESRFALTDGGCEVAFPYQITACTPEGLTFRTRSAQRVAVGCAPEPGEHLLLEPQVLLRLAAPDGG
jgi:hypothetical protein